MPYLWCQIEAVPGLRGLPDEVLARLCMQMKPLKVMIGDNVYKEGERCVPLL